MKKRYIFLSIYIVLAVILVFYFLMGPDTIIRGPATIEATDSITIALPHPYPLGTNNQSELVWSHTLTLSDANAFRLRFEEVGLGPSEMLIPRGDGWIKRSPFLTVDISDRIDYEERISRMSGHYVVVKDGEENIVALIYGPCDYHINEDPSSIGLRPSQRNDCTLGFSTSFLPGDTATVELYADNRDGGRGFIIHGHGYP